MIEQSTVLSETKIPSKRMLGRLKSVYDNCQLTLVSGEFNGQKAKSRQFNGYMPLPPETNTGQVTNYGVKFPQVVGKMLLVGEPTAFQESYIEGLGGIDFQNLPEIAAQITRGAKPSVVIRLVYGATTEMPFRALSYLLPALIYMEHTGNVISQLQVIFVNNISSHLDRLDTSTALKQVKDFAGIAKAYIRSFFPNSDRKTIFLEDTPLDRGSDLRRRLLTLATSLRKTASEDLLDDLERKAVNNGSGRTYAFYGAAHVLIHDIDIPGSLVPLLPDQPEIVVNPEVIVSIGGRKEEIFYRLRHILKPHLDPEYNNAKTLQFFTRHRVPPYCMARGGDVALGDVMKGSSDFVNKNVAPVVSYDLCYLNEVSARRGDLGNFLKKYKGRHRYE